MISKNHRFKFGDGSPTSPVRRTPHLFGEQASRPGPSVGLNAAACAV